MRSTGNETTSSSLRGRHGFDRTMYAPQILAEYESGLAKIGSEENAARRRSAESLAAP
jgi:hypothetical protein